MKRSIFTGMAYETVNLISNIKILSIKKNITRHLVFDKKSEVEIVNIDIPENLV